MLMVVVIIAVISGGTAAYFGGRQDRCALRMAGSDLAAVLQYACANSYYHESLYQLRFPADFGGFRLEKVNAEGDSLPAQGIAGKEHRFAQGVCLTGIERNDQTDSQRPETVLIGPAEVTGCEKVTLHLVNRRSETLNVVWLTEVGQVYVEP
jgi:hypothetical protein